MFTIIFVLKQPPAATESSSSTEEKIEKAKIEKAKELIEIRRREKADKEKEVGYSFHASQCCIA